MWDEITYPFSNFNSWTVEVWEWISNSILDIIIDVITYPCWEWCYIWFFYYSPAHYNDTFMLCFQWHCCWWPGTTRNEGAKTQGSPPRTFWSQYYKGKMAFTSNSISRENRSYNGSSTCFSAYLYQMFESTNGHLSNKDNKVIKLLTISVCWYQYTAREITIVLVHISNVFMVTHIK